MSQSPLTSTTTTTTPDSGGGDIPTSILRLFPPNTYLQLPDSRTPRHQEHDTLSTGQVCIHKHPHRGPLGRHANETIDEFELNSEIRTAETPWMDRTEQNRRGRRVMYRKEQARVPGACIWRIFVQILKTKTNSNTFESEFIGTSVHWYWYGCHVAIAIAIGGDRSWPSPPTATKFVRFAFAGMRRSEFRSHHLPPSLPSTTGPCTLYSSLLP